MGNVAFLDSGIGGFAYLQRFRQLEPQHEIHYIADTQGFPYGTKSVPWVRERVLKIARALIEKTQCENIVISCNTASVIALDELRTRLASLIDKTAIIGVVPAIKLAVDSFYKNVYVMSTPLTASTNYTKDLMDEYGKGVDFTVRGTPDLVEAVERMLLSSPKKNHDDLKRFTKEVNEILMSVIADAVSHDAQVIVLACTHFLHVKTMLEILIKKQNKKIVVVDSLNGVVRQIISRTSHGGPTKETAKETVAKEAVAKKAGRANRAPSVYVTSLDASDAYKYYAEKNNFVFGGLWQL